MSARALSFIVALCILRAALAHDLPMQLPDPQSTPEAWNVLEQSAANVDDLLKENLLRDIAFQVANTSRPAIYLSQHADKNSDIIQALTEDLMRRAATVVVTSRETGATVANTQTAWTAYREKLKDLEAMYPQSVVHADIFVCPMHPMDRHLRPDEKCSICGMSLIRRHLPASSIYQQPGQPTLKMSAISSPLIVGQKAEVKIHLTKPDGSPVLLTDLVEVHTKKIHLLINDHSLSDYHHEHPLPTEAAGQYSFSFTPQKPGPYRLWADVVPSDTSRQEYVIADLPANTPPQPLQKTASTSLAIVNGRKYELLLNDNHPIHAAQTVVGVVTIANPDGSPFTQLEPVMGAFAHIVGFSEDGASVLHIHPYGKDPASPTDRAGPAFTFKFYSPTPGFLKLYVQVQIAGKQEFAPFAINVLPTD